VIIPTGAGSNVLGCDLGFGELCRAGELRAPPRLFCVQPLACSPIATAVLAALGRDDGKTPPAEWNVPAKTIAEGTSIARPVRLQECVAAVRASGGGAVRVAEQQIREATLELAQLGMYTEPTCAQAAAAYHELIADGTIRAEQVTVLILTSTGVKATPSVAAMLGVDL